MRRLVVAQTFAHAGTAVAWKRLEAGALVCRHHESVDARDERLAMGDELDRFLAAHPQTEPFPREEYDALIARQQRERMTWVVPALALDASPPATPEAAPS